MASRACIALIIIAAAMSDCPSASGGTTVTLHSKRRNVSISATPPSGWGGPGYGAWPSHDSFSWSHGKESAACYLSVRFDSYRDEPDDPHSADDIAIHWNSTPLAKIREQYKRDFQNPQIERIATVSVAGKLIRVHAVYDADGHFYAAEVRRGDTVISFELRSASRRELQRHKESFLTFVRSVRIP